MPSGTSYPFSTLTNLIVPKAVTESKQNLSYHLSEPQEPNMRFSAGSLQGINTIKNWLIDQLVDYMWKY